MVGPLWFTWKRGVLREKVFAKSNLVIDWVNRLVEMQNMQLIHLMNKLCHLINHFTKIYFMHVYMELNMQADVLSKGIIGQINKNLYFQENTSSQLIDSGFVLVF